MDICKQGDVFRRREKKLGVDFLHVLAGKDSSPARTPEPTADDGCPKLELVEADACPKDVDFGAMVPCDDPELVVGDFCEGDGEWSSGVNLGVMGSHHSLEREALFLGDLSLSRVCQRLSTPSQESVPTQMLWDGELVSRLEVSRREWTLFSLVT